jgi:hypothetical protein
MNIIIPMTAGYFFFNITSGHYIRTIILGQEPTDLKYFAAIHFPLVVGFFVTALTSYLMNL